MEALPGMAQATALNDRQESKERSVCVCLVGGDQFWGVLRQSRVSKGMVVMIQVCAFSTHLFLDVWLYPSPWFRDFPYKCTFLSPKGNFYLVFRDSPVSAAFQK